MAESLTGWAAVAWAKAVRPSVVRVKEDVLLSDLEQAAGGVIEAPWIETRPEEERVYIRSGVTATIGSSDEEA